MSTGAAPTLDVDRINGLKLEPGEVLVVFYPHERTPAEALVRAGTLLREYLPDRKVILLPSDWRAGAGTKEETLQRLENLRRRIDEAILTVAED